MKYQLFNILIFILLRYCPSCSLIDALSVKVKENLNLIEKVLGVSIGTTYKLYADESRVRDMDVYAENAALKRTRVLCM